MDHLLALDCEGAGELWGSVLGRAAGHWLRGEDFEMSETEHLKSMSHQHVLAPEMRTRGEGLGGGAQTAAQGGNAAAGGRPVGQQHWAGNRLCRAARRKQAGEPIRTCRPGDGRARCGSASARTIETLIAALSRLWASRPSGAEYEQPYFIGVHLNGLVPDRLHTLNLFEGTEDEQSRTRLLEAMDALNNKYGMSTLAPATMLTAFRAAPTRIAFHTIPEMF